MLNSDLSLPEEDYEDQTARILRARAKALAGGEPENHEEDEPYLEVVEFLLGDEKYCIELIHIREVYPLKDITPLPCTPEFVIGIINFRGQILSIIDLKYLFNLPTQEDSEHRVIILRSDEMEFGVLADEILGVRRICISEIQPASAMFTGTGAEYTRGVTTDRAAILDGEKILSDKKIVVHQEV